MSKDYIQSFFAKLLPRLYPSAAHVRAGGVDTMAGKTEASHTDRPTIPRSLRFVSTTQSSSSLSLLVLLAVCDLPAFILHVPQK